jgi:hypothetical protein
MRRKRKGKEKPTSHKRRQLERRKKIDALRAQGFTFTQIARKLGISKMTAIRDQAIADEELVTDPRYVEDRTAIRKAIGEHYMEELAEIKKDMEAIRQGSKVLEETSKSPKKKDIKEITDPEELLGVTMGARQIEITRKILGPNWIALAAHHKALLELLRDWAKLWGLMIDRETQIKETKETERVYGVMVVPARARDAKEWEENFVLPYKDRKVIETEPLEPIEKGKETP